jgi:hypothetical protein
MSSNRACGYVWERRMFRTTNAIRNTLHALTARHVVIAP